MKVIQLLCACAFITCVYLSTTTVVDAKDVKGTSTPSSDVPTPFSERVHHIRGVTDARDAVAELETNPACEPVKVKCLADAECRKELSECMERFGPSVVPINKYVPKSNYLAKFKSCEMAYAFEAKPSSLQQVSIVVGKTISNSNSASTPAEAIANAARVIAGTAMPPNINDLIGSINPPEVLVKNFTASEKSEAVKTIVDALPEEWRSKHENLEEYLTPLTLGSSGELLQRNFTLGIATGTMSQLNVAAKKTEEGYFKLAFSAGNVSATLKQQNDEVSDCTCVVGGCNSWLRVEPCVERRETVSRADTNAEIDEIQMVLSIEINKMIVNVTNDTKHLSGSMVKKMTPAVNIERTFLRAIKEKPTVNVKSNSTSSRESNEALGVCTRCAAAAAECGIMCACTYPVCECCTQCGSCLVDQGITGGFDDCCQCLGLCDDNKAAVKDASSDSTKEIADVNGNVSSKQAPSWNANNPMIVEGSTLQSVDQSALPTPTGILLGIVGDEIEKLSESLSQPTDSKIVEKLQKGLKSLAQETNTIVDMAVDKQDVPEFVQITLRGFENTTQMQLLGKIDGSEKQAGWCQKSYTSMTKGKLNYYTAYFEHDVEGGYNLVICTLSSKFDGDKMEVYKNVWYDKQGTRHENITVKHSPFSRNDTTRLENQMELNCDQQAYNQLKGQLKSKMKIKVMESVDLPSQPSWLAHNHVIKVPNLLAKIISRPDILLLPVPGSKFHMYAVIAKNNSNEDAMKMFENAILNTNGIVKKIAGAISDFISSEHSSVKWISRHGEFSRFFESVNAYVIPGIKNTDDCMKAIKIMVEATISDNAEKIIEQLSVLLLSHKNTSGWTKHNVLFNATTGGRARTLSFLHIVDEDGYVDLAYCSINATFQTLGDIQITSTTPKYLGGLFSGDTKITEVVEPPYWTQNDTETLDEYFSLMCEKYFAQILGLPPIHVPPIPIHH